MKKIAAMLVVLLPFSTSAQQVPKTIVAEHFTNTYCSVCASRNPGLYSNLQNFPEVLYISYHPSSPYPACPLNQHNVAENDLRTNYYGVYGGTPQLIVQGRQVSGSYTNAAIFQSQQGNKSSFKVNISLSTHGTDSLLVRTAITKADTSSLLSLRLYGAIVEDTLFFTANNGERVHRNVFRKSIWQGNYLSITAPATVGDSVVQQAIIPKHAGWVLPRIFAIALLQDDDKNMVQAAKTQNLTIPTKIEPAGAVIPQLVVYPNPAGDLIHITTNTSTESSIVIEDLNGKVCFRGALSGNKATVNVSGWTSGTYFIRTGNTVKTFIKQ